MARFRLKDSEEYYLALSEQPKRFDADSPVTNVFFDDSNGQVFTVRSGGVTGVTVTGMDESKSTSFRMEDRGPIISIKFSPDLKILAIQRNQDNQNATVEFVNFKDLAPTNVEYSHTCKWKNAKILGFVWPKVNEITFITDHGIELLQVIPDKKQLKSLKNTSFSCAWFSWCSQSNIVLLAGNNGVLLQPFSLNNSTISKLQKLELEATRPVVERDVFTLRLCDATWCAIFRHAQSATVAAPGPTEVPKDEISKIVAVLLRRTDGKDTIYRVLNQLVAEAGTYLVQLSDVFDEIHTVYRKWADLEMARNTAGQAPQAEGGGAGRARVLISQAELCAHVLQQHSEAAWLVQVVTCYVASLARAGLVVQAAAAELAVRALPVAGLGAARQAGLGGLAPRKLLAAARAHAQAHGRPTAFTAVYHALLQRNERTRGSPHFLKGEQCDSYVEYYKQITAEPQ
ncbi:unnamed protein product [Spodoptera littoralis]|uniref:Mic1 domain-containing protein n=1 Tax=Spodoptera littoralis TaxID=7109 RepID=A0A9P0HZS0_SPOLI|nr:unnamed protein product [Spodoptera littoralis]CAH1638486.1 unnamed protein product [Spodoptera littoralis]